MFMIVVTVAFLILLASNFLGVFMLLAGISLLFSRVWRRTGYVALGAGLFGAALALAAVAIFKYLSGAAELMWEAWLMFGIAGFGWASLIAVGAATVLLLLRQPARWVDRKRAHR